MTDKQIPPSDAPLGTAHPLAGLPVFDHLAALTRLDNDKELLATLLTMAFDIIPEVIAAMDESLLSRDTRQLALNAHKLKGAAAAIGAVTLAFMATQVQNLAIEKQHMLISASMAILKSEFIKFQDEAKKTSG